MFTWQLTIRTMVIEKDSNIFDLIANKTIGPDEMADPISGQRLLHYAVLMNFETLVDFLIENNANLMVRDFRGYTPLLKAAALGRISIVRIVII
jgi:hypothetical protein